MIRVLLVFLSMVSLTAFAQTDAGPLFGPEFTFARANGEQANLSAIEQRMQNHLIHGQSEGAKFKDKDESLPGMHFTSPNGWALHLFPDPGVIEVQMLPMTVDEFARYANDIQDAIFVSAANEDHHPNLFLGGGHINIDVAYFLEKPLLFRNFIVDLYNHNELFMGIFGYDTHNALPIDLVTAETADYFRKAVDVFDHEWRTSGGVHADVHELAQRLYVAAGKSKDDFYELWHKWGRNRQFAVNFQNAYSSSKDARIEIRAFRPQDSFHTFLNQIRLLRNRLHYLSQFTEPIPWKRQTKLKPFSHAKEVKLNPPVDPMDALKNFYIYVRESGESWADHRNYIWPMWISDGTREQFESSPWFCEQLLR